MNKTEEIANKIVKQFKDEVEIEILDNTYNNNFAILVVILDSYSNPELRVVSKIVNEINSEGFNTRVYTEFNPMNLTRFCRIVIEEKENKTDEQH